MGAAVRHRKTFARHAASPVRVSEGVRGPVAGLAEGRGAWFSERSGGGQAFGLLAAKHFPTRPNCRSSADRWLRVTAARSGLEITGAGPGKLSLSISCKRPTGRGAGGPVLRSPGALVSRVGLDLRGLRAIDFADRQRRRGSDLSALRFRRIARIPPSASPRRENAGRVADRRAAPRRDLHKPVAKVARRRRSPRGSYCLNHRQASAASAEERRERELCGENRPRPFAGGGREGDGAMESLRVKREVDERRRRRRRRTRSGVVGVAEKI
ncbi:hypothetical protein Q5P01_000133 [Channa striata]|uniref:Uncharacterized protein n=1 Tax=Channa striata TaxID=64152 RepID=A0AA88ICH8_CHASR|nr:hypothetical protein Q5P01_000133 [Channa striata]